MIQDLKSAQKLSFEAATSVKSSSAEAVIAAELNAKELALRVKQAERALECKEDTLKVSQASIVRLQSGSALHLFNLR